MESWPLPSPSFSVFWLHFLLARPSKRGLRDRVRPWWKGRKAQRSQQSRPPSSWWSALEVKFLGGRRWDGEGPGPCGCLTPELLCVTSNGTCLRTPAASSASILPRPSSAGLAEPPYLSEAAYSLLGHISLFPSRTWLSFLMLMQVEKIFL